MNGGIGSTMANWLVESAATLLTNIIVVVIVVVVGKLLITWACVSLRRSLQKARKVSDLMEGFIVNVTAKVLWVLVFLVVASQLGIAIVPLITSLGVAGFIIGFAFQETLGNLAAGFMLAINEPFTVGHWVDIAGIMGTVQDMNMVTTTLTTADNKRVMVPNSKVWGNAITNYNALDTRRIEIGVGISYGANIGKARDVILETLKGCDKILEDPAPIVAVMEMGDSSINLVVRPWVKTDDYWTVFFDMNKAIKEALDSHDIEIPFPQLDVHHFGLDPKALGS